MSDFGALLRPFDTTDPDGLHHRWLVWKQRLLDVFVMKNVTTDATKLAYLRVLGGEGLANIVINSFGAITDFNDLVQRLETHFNPAHNSAATIFQFRRIAQFEGEGFDEFVIRIRAAARGCAFAAPDIDIAQQIIQGCRYDSLKREAIRSRTRLTLAELIQLGRV